MGHRTNNLYAFSISKDDNEQDNNLIEMWHELDNDCSPEGMDESTLRADLIEKVRYTGYKSYAEFMIKTKDWIEDGHDDVSKIERVLSWIEDTHGDFSSQFQSVISEGENEYSVAVSYLT